MNGAAVIGTVGFEGRAVDGNRRVGARDHELGLFDFDAYDAVGGEWGRGGIGGSEGEEGGLRVVETGVVEVRV